MTGDELRQALDALPPEAQLTLAVRDLREALGNCGESPSVAGNHPAPDATTGSSDRLLTAQQVADCLGTSRRYVYAQRHVFPFTRQLPGVGVRFSEQGLQRWIRQP